MAAWSIQYWFISVLVPSDFLTFLIDIGPISTNSLLPAMNVPDFIL